MSPDARILRADARRNRGRLLQAAREVFAEQGVETALEDVARRSGLGIGTLYRHFPTREALVGAVYSHAVEQLAASADQLLEEVPPGEALRAWLALFVDYLATKKVIAPSLNAMAGGASGLYATSGGVMRAAVSRLVRAGVAAGELRPDIEPEDVMQALAGLAYGSGEAGWRERALRLADVLTLGLRAN